MPVAATLIWEELQAERLAWRYMPIKMYPPLWSRGLVDEQYIADAWSFLWAVPGWLLLTFSWHMRRAASVGENRYRYAFPEQVLQLAKTSSDLYDQVLRDELNKLHLYPLTDERINNFLGDQGKRRLVKRHFQELIRAVTHEPTKLFQDEWLSAGLRVLLGDHIAPSGVMRHYWLNFYRYAYANYVPWEAMNILPRSEPVSWLFQAANATQDAVLENSSLQAVFDTHVWDEAVVSLEPHSDHSLCRRFAVLWRVIRTLREQGQGVSIPSDNYETHVQFYSARFGTAEYPQIDSPLAKSLSNLTTKQPPEQLSASRKKSLWNVFPSKKSSDEEKLRPYIQYYSQHNQLNIAVHARALQNGNAVGALIWLHPDYVLTGEYFSVSQYQAVFKEEPADDIIIDGRIYVMKKKHDNSGLYRSKPADSISLPLILLRCLSACAFLFVQMLLYAVQLLVILPLGLLNTIYYWAYKPLQTTHGQCVLSTICVVVSALCLVQAYTTWLLPFSIGYQAVLSVLVSWGWAPSSVMAFIQISSITMFTCALVWAECCFAELPHVQKSDVDIQDMLWKPFHMQHTAAFFTLCLYAASLHPAVAPYAITPIVVMGIGTTIALLNVVVLSWITIRFTQIRPAINVSYQPSSSYIGSEHSVISNDGSYDGGISPPFYETPPR